MLTGREVRFTVVQTEAHKGTRERILDVALDLFTTKGFDKTSLREIADELGFTKAALYYHFASKDDILLALHLRFHDLIAGAVAHLEAGPATPAAWAAFIDEVITEVFGHRKLLLLHERNRAALEQLHDKGHEGQHEEFEDKFRALLADPSISMRDRVRLSCALGAMLGGIMMIGDASSDASPQAVGELVREAVRDLLQPAMVTPDGGAP